MSSIAIEAIMTLKLQLPTQGLHLDVPKTRQAELIHQLAQWCLSSKPSPLPSGEEFPPSVEDTILNLAI